MENKVYFLIILTFSQMSAMASKECIDTVLNRPTGYKHCYQSEKSELSKEKKKYNIFKGTIDVEETSFIKDLENNLITFEYDIYKTKNLSPKALIVLTPSIVGVSIIERNVASFFAKNGFDVVIPISYETPITYDESTAKQIDRGFVRALIQMDFYLSNTREYSAYFAIGASQGGIRSISLIANTKIFNKAYTYVPGGNFPLIYAQTDVESLIDFRENHMLALGITNRDDYENYLKNNLTFDPLKSCKSIDIPVDFFLADKDNSVPTRSQYELYEECSKYTKTQKKSLNVGHVIGVSKILIDKWSILKDIKSFL